MEVDITSTRGNVIQVPSRSTTGIYSINDHESNNRKSDRSIVTKGDDRTRQIGGRQCQISYNGNPFYCEVNTDVACVQVNCSTDGIIESNDSIGRCPEK